VIPLINILLSGVGGQGTVLAAKILAAAAETKGWQVRSAETIGMAQRGGSVVSHVRMGNLGEEVHSSLLAKGSADVIIAFEPAEAARVLEYLSPRGTVVTAITPVQPVTTALAGKGYQLDVILQGIEKSLLPTQRLVQVDDAALLAGANRKALNTVLIASAVKECAFGIAIDDIRAALRSCVKPVFVDMNLAAVDKVLQS